MRISPMAKRKTFARGDSVGDLVGRKPTAKELAARQFRHGQLITGIEAARSALALAERSRDLLSSDDIDRMRTAVDLLGGIEQRAWTKANEERK